MNEVLEYIRIILLGGIGEIGKNMMLIEYHDGLIVVDAGMMFPEEHMPGIDCVIPDFSYVLDNRKKVKAILLTHGHEDHIGALPYLLRELNVPIYGTKLTLGFAKIRLEEHYLPYKPLFHEIVPRQKVSFGDITAEFFRVCHSVADGVGIAFHTPFGIIIHSGDFKFDTTPIYEHYFDFYKLAEFGEKGVLFLMSDSTNAENKGYTTSEKELNILLFDVIFNAKGRVLVATFASNIHRIQQIFDVCMRTGRKLAILGKSMEKNIAMAKDLGYLKFSDSMVIQPDRIKSQQRDKVVLLTTGTQGEPMSALSQIAHSRHKLMDIENGDTVILSASIIPGNEKTVTKIVNCLFKRGALVFYEGFEDLHVSGHASREELKLLMAITKPEYFMPIHGEFRHLIHHSNLAKEMGIEKKNIILAEDGDVITIDRDGISVTDKVAAGHIYIDGNTIGNFESTVLKDRTRLSEDGIVVVILPLTLEGHGIMQPEIFSRGFIYPQNREDFIIKAKDIVFDVVRNCIKEKGINEGALKTSIKNALKSYFRRETTLSPMIVPIVVEV